MRFRKILISIAILTISLGTMSNSPTPTPSPSPSNAELGTKIDKLTKQLDNFSPAPDKQSVLIFVLVMLVVILFLNFAKMLPSDSLEKSIGEIKDSLNEIKKTQSLRPPSIAEIKPQVLNIQVLNQGSPINVTINGENLDRALQPEVRIGRLIFYPNDFVTNSSTSIKINLSVEAFGILQNYVRKDMQLEVSTREGSATHQIVFINKTIGA